MTRSRSFWTLPQRPDFTGIFAGRRVIPALALVLAGCGGTVSVEDSPDRTFGTSPLAQLVAPVYDLCVQACEAEQVCYAESGVEVSDCVTDCFAFYDTLADDTPSVRACVAARQAELTCFAGLDCAGRAAYYGGEVDSARPCYTEDMATLEVCAGI
jgi:hypothetical protein